MDCRVEEYGSPVRSNRTIIQGEETVCREKQGLYGCSRILTTLLNRLPHLSTVYHQGIKTVDEEQKRSRYILLLMTNFLKCNCAVFKFSI